jgi:Fic family protein
MPPPPLPQLVESVRAKGVDHFADIVSRGYELEAASAPYLPWDKLRYKNPPDGLDHREWWLVTKLSRQGLQRKLPLLDKDRRHFTYALPDAALKGIEEVTRHLSGHIGIGERVTTSAHRNRYLINSLIEEAITSSQLEGAQTTFAVAKDMIRSGRPPVNRDERMIYNNYAAMQRIRELKGSPVSIEGLHELHRIVTDGTLEDPDGAGRFQTPDEERVVVGGPSGEVYHRPPPASELPERMRTLCDFMNGTTGDAYVPGVVRAIITHFMIGYEHPFQDGNGRTARALFYWMMLNQNYWLTEFVSISRILKGAPSQYEKSFLHSEQDDADLTYFILYQLEVLQRAIGELNSYLDRKVQEVRDFQRSLATMPGEFNHRQLALLQHALRHPDAVYTVQSHGSSHNVVKQTARQDLLDLEARGALVRRTRGRAFVWSPVADLVQHLENSSSA